VECLRENGMPIGMIKLRVFRPFPARELAAALAGKKAVAVFDRSDTFAGGMGGPVFIELRSALFEEVKRPLLVNYIYGLGGRDLNVEMINNAANELAAIAGSGTVKQRISYLGLR
jgi:pyruvate ferredoxin oxidoreductase alpha subunit